MSLVARKKKRKKESAAKENKDLIERFKSALGDKVKEVEVSTRLTDSPSCVISDSNRMMTNQMKRLMEATGQKLPDEKYTLELNPEHPLVKKAYAEIDEAQFKKWAEVIFEQALLADQGGLKDPSSFVKNLDALLLG